MTSCAQKSRPPPANRQPAAWPGGPLDIDTAPAVAWNALTEPDGLAGWWSTRLTTPSRAAVGVQIHWTFARDFNPVMETTRLDELRQLEWRCVAGHENWEDDTFRFELVSHGEGRTRLRFWQDYAVELSDDDFGIYNFNWGYYLESLRVFCGTGTGKPFPAAPPT